MTAIDGRYVNPVDLDGQDSSIPLLEMSLGESDEGSGTPAPQATKQSKTMRPRTPHSDSLNTSNSSRLSGLGLDVRFGPNADHREQPGENLGRSRYLPKSAGVENGDHENSRKGIWSKHRGKGRSPRFISPPASGRGSSLVSTASDARSEASIAQFPASPRSNIDIERDEVNGDPHELLQTPDPECPRYVPVSYPQTIQLSDSPQSNSKRWSEPRFWLHPDFVMAADDSITHDFIASPGQLYVYEKSMEDVFQSEKADTDVFKYDDYSVLADQMGQPSSPMVGNPISDSVTSEATQALRPHAGDSSLWLADELLDYRSTIPQMSIAASGSKELEETTQANETAQSITNDGMLSVVQVDSKTLFQMYVNKGDLGNSEDWRSHIPDSLDWELVDPQSPSHSILMTIAEEELEERVSRALYYDENLASILKSKLKHKLSFILPLFLDGQAPPFGFLQRYSYSGYERGTPRTSTPNSTPNSGPSTSSKSTNAATTATPATTADTGGAREEDEDSQRPNKRQRRPNPPDPVDQGCKRRRLRCHFHAKSPSTHQRKTCMVSGWLSIHHLEDHYRAHHTHIRCNKCFQEFASKPPKNAHQKSCKTDAPAPSFDVIDCDKTDEIKDCFKTLRSWRLDTERDGDMKSWITKHKSELASNEVPLKDAYDSRELAKWYIMWRLLFPDHQGQVPSPFQNISLLPEELMLERVLEVFQSTVEANVKNHQRPPSDLGQQIEYYKDVIRMVFHVLQASPNSTPRACTATRIPSDRCPAVNTSSNRHDIVPPTLTPDPLRDESPEDQSFPNDLTLCQPADFAYSSPPSIGNLNSGILAPVSLGSPYAAETRGAVGESPNIRTLQQGLPMPHTNTASNYQPAVGSQGRTSSIPQMPVFTPAQDGVGSALVLQSGMNARSMRPPPFVPQRGRSVPSLALQHIPQLLLPNQLHYSQSNHTQPAHSPAGSYVSRFPVVDSTTGFSFANGESYQGAQSWNHSEMGLYGNLGCMHCYNTGLISTGTGMQQQCPCTARGSL